MGSGVVQKRSRFDVRTDTPEADLAVVNVKCTRLSWVEKHLAGDKSLDR